MVFCCGDATEHLILSALERAAFPVRNLRALPRSIPSLPFRQASAGQRDGIVGALVRGGSRRAALGHQVHCSIASRGWCAECEAAIRAGLRLGDLRGRVCTRCPESNCRADDRLTCDENLTFELLLCGRRRSRDHYCRCKGEKNEPPE
jgi:hypothetical protein